MTTFFSARDVEQIIEQTCLKQIDVFSELESTNSYALSSSDEKKVDLPWAIVALHQTAGRGRGSNQWYASSGSLTFTLVFDSVSLDISQSRWQQVSLMTAVAIAEALEPVLLGTNLHLKWPNDIYANGRKLCGILVEQNNDRLHIGIGININNSFELAPAEVRDKAISVTELSGREEYLPDIFLRIVKQLNITLAECKEDFSPLLPSWIPRCLLKDRTVEIKSGSQIISGYCQSINEQGALLLATEGEIKPIFAGEVIKF